MWPQIRTLLLILSLSLNGSFLAVWLVYAAPFHFFSANKPVEITAPGGIWSPLYREIGVNVAQWQIIEPKLVELQKKAKEHKATLAFLRNKMLDLLASPDPTQEEIRSNQEEIISEQRSMQDLVINYFFDDKKILNVEQQKKLFDIARKNGGGCKVLPIEGSSSSPCS